MHFNSRTKPRGQAAEGSAKHCFFRIPAPRCLPRTFRSHSSANSTTPRRLHAQTTPLSGSFCYCAILSPSGCIGSALPQARCVFSRDTAIRVTDVPLAQTARWRAVVRVLRSPIDGLSCALLPSSCDLCGSPLPQLSSVPICPVCWSEFSVQTGAVCARCGDALIAPEKPTHSMLCRACRLAPPPFVRAVSYGLYQGRMREAIHALKYDRLHPAAEGLGGMLAQGHRAARR